MSTRLSTPVFSPSLERMRQHWEVLCERIGERRAGSAGEKAAADYVMDQFGRAGLVNVHEEEFACVTTRQAFAEVELGVGGKWQKVEARVLAGAPGTPGEKMVEGEVVWVEMPEQGERAFKGSMKGKVVVLFGPLPTRADLFARMVKSSPAAVIQVDDRLPFEWVKDDGVYPAWAKRYGMPPTVTMSYRAAWALRKQGASRARARIVARLAEGVSQNVVAEIAGRRPELPVVLLGAHHDTQCNNAGADDNASGVVALLELARMLGARKPLRTIRLVSFGTEEQLSVGSAKYVEAHRKEMKSIGAVLNVDSVSSPLGHHWMFRAGTQAFGAWLVKSLGREGLDVMEKSAAMPFADHFPFSVFGVPAMTLYRPNVDGGGRWQHHSANDTLEHVSAEELARVIAAVAGVTWSLAGAGKWAFGRGLAPEQRAETARVAKDLFGLKA